MRPVRLIAIDQTLERTLEIGPEKFESRYSVQLGGALEMVRQVVKQTLAMNSWVLVAPPWGGYIAADSQTLEVIGTCAFKGIPTGDGVVEIAYFTFPAFEGRGYATGMAKALLAIASSSASVRCVIAYTLPQPNASTRVLEKIGMRFSGEVEDPKDGRVWRWECWLNE